MADTLISVANALGLAAIGRADDGLNIVRGLGTGHQMSTVPKNEVPPLFDSLGGLGSGQGTLYNNQSESNIRARSDAFNLRRYTPSHEEMRQSANLHPISEEVVGMDEIIPELGIANEQVVPTRRMILPDEPINEGYHEDEIQVPKTITKVVNNKSIIPLTMFGVIAILALAQ